VIKRAKLYSVALYNEFMPGVDTVVVFAYNEKQANELAQAHVTFPTKVLQTVEQKIKIGCVRVVHSWGDFPRVNKEI
jgi:hypothetical protein